MKPRLLRWLAALAGVAFLALFVHGIWRLTLDPEIEARNRALSDELARIEAHNGRLRTEVASLQGEIRRLREDESESLHRARTGLGMVRAGEVVYQLAPPAPGVGGGQSQ